MTFTESQIAASCIDKEKFRKYLTAKIKESFDMLEEMERGIRHLGYTEDKIEGRIDAYRDIRTAINRLVSKDA